MTIDEEKFLVYALTKYPIDYCFEHMDEVLAEYRKEHEDEDSRHSSNQ